jgi:hypothetical protein
LCCISLAINMTRKANSQRGQAVTELALQIPLALLLLFGAVQVARIFYVYHTLQKAVRGGAGVLARSVNVDYCHPVTDMALADARNFIVYGTLQPSVAPVVSGLTPELIQILPERVVSGAGTQPCTCPDSADTADPDSCDVTFGRPPDFVVINFLGSGFPLTVPFPFVTVGPINLKVSVRMPVTGS